MDTASKSMARKIGAVACVMIVAGLLFWLLIAAHIYTPPDSVLLLMVLFGVGAVIVSMLAAVSRPRWLLATLAAVLVLVGLLAMALES
ncbi:MAG TPA: hypothetical protein VFL42_03060 [Terriglobales bacterium]|nr:hypothetical protein [Terriglobales bacterium]